MSTRENLKKPLSVNITALGTNGEVADVDMSVDEFISYMNELSIYQCEDFENFTVTFLNVPKRPLENNFKDRVLASNQ